MPLWRTVYTLNMEVEECPVLEVQRGHTHTHTDRHFPNHFVVTLQKEEGQCITKHIHAPTCIYSVFKFCTYSRDRI